MPHSTITGPSQYGEPTFANDFSIFASISFGVITGTMGRSSLAFPDGAGGGSDLISSSSLPVASSLSAGSSLPDVVFPNTRSYHRLTFPDAHRECGLALLPGLSSILFLKSSISCDGAKVTCTRVSVPEKTAPSWGIGLLVLSTAWYGNSSKTSLGYSNFTSFLPTLRTR